LPLDPVERRDEWHRAVLMVALVVTGMSEHAHGGGTTSALPRSAPRRVTPSAGGSHRHHIRPPRGC
jgi:hypothetical protein